MEGSDEDPSCTVPHRQPPREPKLAIFDASLHHDPVGLDYYGTGLQAWHRSRPLLSSGRSSRASTDNEELESVRAALRQRRLSRHSALIAPVSPADTYAAGLKVIKLAIQEHELPVKMAYEQLDELAANAERVRASIEKNRSLLLLQIQEQKRALKLQDYVATIEKENERSKQECARLSRIIESGEWQRQQFAEILEAKDILSVEREALATLITRLNQQQTAVLEQKEKIDNEMRHFKEQLFGHNFIHHNKMLIRGASSFNTIVRALKIDALKRGVHPEFLCALDRLAMDKVSVFPDGEIRVKTFCNFERGKWVPKVTGSSLPDLSASCNASSLFNKGISPRTSLNKI